MEQISDISKFVGRFHPVIVHLPIGIITLTLLFQLFSIPPYQTKLKPALPLMWFCGFISCFISVILGLLLYSSGEYDEDIVSWHKWSGIALTLATFLYYLSFVIKLDGAIAAYTKYLKPLLIMVIFALLLLSGHNGGSLTHGKGYLTEYAPGFISNRMRESEIKTARKRIESIYSADLFSDAILPIFESKCISCHNKNKRKGQLILASFADIMNGGKHGMEIVPGSSTASELFRRITLPADEKEAMPGEGKKPLSNDQIAIIEWWIDKQAPQKGEVKNLHPDSAMVKILERFFGIKDESQKMPIVEAPDKSVIEHLLKKNYSIRYISMDSYLLDIKSNDTIINSNDLTQLNLIAKNVIWLDLSNGKLTDQDVPLISNCINLRKLNLSKNPISDQGAKHLTKLSKLEYLNLYETAVADSGAIRLGQMQSLRELYLWNTKVSDTLINQLRLLNNTNLKIVYRVP